MKETKKVEVKLKAPASKVWAYWTEPEHITNWNFATDDWHCPTAQNDLEEGGSFNYRMEAKDGKMGFDFYGRYSKVKKHQKIEYQLEDGRKVWINFIEK